MNEFKWTDELALEFAAKYDSIQNQLNIGSSILDHFKQSKQQSNKDWEIVSVKYKADGKIYPFNTIGEDNKFEIHSVRRLSDGEVFTVRDKIWHLDSNYSVTILEFYTPTNKNLMWFICEDDSCKDLKNFTHKHNEPLFTTEDGKDIYEGDVYWIVWGINFSWERNTAYPNEVKNNEAKYFSTYDASQEYILMNKPCLSLNDFKQKLGCLATDKYLLDELKELAKQKINQ